jgi:beta-glucanase (GH16 family)
MKLSVHKPSWFWRTALLTLAAALVAVPLVQRSSTPKAEAAAWTMTWNDEFDGAAGSAPNGSKWGRDIGGGGWGNAELEYYTNSTRNAALSGDGKLIMTARNDDAGGYSCWYGACRYTSSRLLTAGKFTQKYGRFEANIKIPRGGGIWPAFWMLGDNLGSVGWPQSGELDIMENIGREPNIVHGSLHGPGYSGGNSVTGQRVNGAPFADAFHQYAVEWSPTSITWLVDNVPYLTKGPADTRGNPWVFDHPFFMILNMAVGGSWPGNPDGSLTFPQTMSVDYVRVYSGSSGGGGTGRSGRITGIGGACIDVNGGSTTNGTAIQLYACLGTPSAPVGSQNWTVSTDGTLRAKGKCMDVTGANPANGTRIQLYDCNGTAAQQWVAGANGQLRNTMSNRCLDAIGNTSANYTRLQIWDCSATGQANQRWTLP